MADYLHRIKCDDPFWDFMHERLEANERKQEEMLKKKLKAKHQFSYPRKTLHKKGKDRR
jgi:hexokinase